MAKPILVGDPVYLTREDMGRLAAPAYQPQITTLRDSHHRLAKLAAIGLRPFQIADETGYSQSRVDVLLKSPAMVDLIAEYRTADLEAFAKNRDEYYSLAKANMLKAERQISDRLDDADDGLLKLSLKDLTAIARDGADRFGYSKRSIVGHKDLDFASKMEAAARRSDAAPVRELEHEG